MRTSKQRQDSGPVSVEGAGVVPTPTHVLTKRAGIAEVRVTLPPGTSSRCPTPAEFDRALDALAGPQRDRDLLALDDYLLERAVAGGGDLSGVLACVPSYTRGVTPKLERLTADCVESYRRPHLGRPRRGASSLAESFKTLAVALGIPVAAITAAKLRETVRRARQRRSVPAE